jgi:cysteine desulfurase
MTATTRPIYLDYNASTPVDPAVAEAMRPFFDGAFGNPSSGHWASAPAKAALDRARSQVAGLLGAAPDEIVFTSGGSEANNLAIEGTFFALNRRGRTSSLRPSSIPPFLLPADFLNGSVLPSPTFRWTGRAWSIQRTCGAPLLRRRC